ncbi:hypothetical protein RhiirC2_800464 [Rhizophagus irregularis]|uniref:NADP-dependent oxidoreductase domain-containing protein n=1 Tax=Rhizophagus irregularis TaxID=588596 RepID=A0A2N1M3M3_9GLOM|nr:hypothetical protein RhiirC2_800464 [Rhizophagus irregularis]
MDFLTGKYKRETNINLKSNYRNRSIINYSKDEKNWQILDEVIAISKEINRSPIQIALNWIQQKPVPFPYSMTDSFDVFIGKNMQVPNKFAPIATTYNYGRLY